MLIVISEVERINWLFDFYGPLLTARQRQAVERYYQDDLSLAEMAEEFGVSRQAIHDMLRRAVRQLVDYEARLGLVARFAELRESMEILDRLLEQGSLTGETGKVAQAKELIRRAMGTI